MRGIVGILNRDRLSRLNAIGGAVLILLLLGISVYRAQTQSITIDEATTYLSYVKPTVRQAWSSYDANNHILFSLLAKASTSLFGVSEFSIRLPSIVGGAIYLISLFWLYQIIFGQSLVLLPFYAATACNPFVLDYLSAGRGYGLALGLWIAGFSVLFSCMRKAAQAIDITLVLFAGVLLGLSAAANLAFVFPILGLLVVAIPLLLFATHSNGKILACVALLASSSVIAGVIIYVPLSHATKASFYHGAHSLFETVESLASYTFFYLNNNFLVSGLPYDMGDTQTNIVIAAGVGAICVLAAIFILCLTTAYTAFKHRRFTVLDDMRQVVLLFGGTTCATFIGMVVAHYAFDVRYPLGRTGIFWLTAVFTLASCLTALLLKYVNRIAITSIVALCAIGCACFFVSEIRLSGYAEWRYDSTTRRGLQIVLEDSQCRELQTVHIESTWMLATTLEFYKELWHLKTFTRIDRIPEKRIDEMVQKGQLDYLLLLPQDYGVLAKFPLKILYRDRSTGLIVARVRAEKSTSTEGNCAERLRAVVYSIS